MLKSNSFRSTIILKSSPFSNSKGRHLRHLLDTSHFYQAAQYLFKLRDDIRIRSILYDSQYSLGTTVKLRTDKSEMEKHELNMFKGIVPAFLYNRQ